MHDLEDFFNKQGFNTINLTLSGHHTRCVDDWKNISLDKWSSELLTQYVQILDKAQKENQEIILCAYSLGAALFHYLFLHNPEIKKPKRLIYFAPALKLRNLKLIVYAFKILPSSLLIPSLNLINYRVWNGTSLAAYRSLLLLEKKIEIYSKQGVSVDIPCLIIIDPLDELVSFKKLKMLKLPTTQFHLVNKKLNILKWKGNHHLIIDSNCLTSIQWEKVLSLIKTHLI